MTDLFTSFLIDLLTIAVVGCLILIILVVLWNSLPRPVRSFIRYIYRKLLLFSRNRKEERPIWTVLSEEKIIRLIIRMRLEPLSDDQLAYIQRRAKRLGVQI